MRIYEQGTYLFTIGTLLLANLASLVLALKGNVILATEIGFLDSLFYTFIIFDIFYRRNGATANELNIVLMAIIAAILSNYLMTTSLFEALAETSEVTNKPFAIVENLIGLTLGVSALSYLKSVASEEKEEEAPTQR